jgi:hypothetical protein
MSNENTEIRPLMFSILRKWSVLWAEFGGKASAKVINPTEVIRYKLNGGEGDRKGRFHFSVIQPLVILENTLFPMPLCPLHVNYL